MFTNLLYIAGTICRWETVPSDSGKALSSANT